MHPENFTLCILDLIMWLKVHFYLLQNFKCNHWLHRNIRINVLRTLNMAVYQKRLQHLPWNTPNSSNYTACWDFLISIQLVSCKLRKFQKWRPARRSKGKKKITYFTTVNFKFFCLYWELYCIQYQTSQTSHVTVCVRTTSRTKAGGDESATTFESAKDRRK